MQAIVKLVLSIPANLPAGQAGFIPTAYPLY